MANSNKDYNMSDKLQVNQTDRDLYDWEKSTHALIEALREQGIIYTEELRVGIDAIPAKQFDLLSHYETWSASVEMLLVNKNVLTDQEIENKVQQMEQRWNTG